MHCPALSSMSVDLVLENSLVPNEAPRYSASYPKVETGSVVSKSDIAHAQNWYGSKGLFNPYSANRGFTPISNSLDPDHVQIYSASHPDRSC